MAAIREDISTEVPRIAVPTLLLAEEYDQLDPVEQHCREVLPRIAQSRLQIIPGMCRQVHRRSALRGEYAAAVGEPP